MWGGQNLMKTKKRLAFDPEVKNIGNLGQGRSPRASDPAQNPAATQPGSASRRSSSDSETSSAMSSVASSGRSSTASMASHVGRVAQALWEFRAEGFHHQIDSSEMQDVIGGAEAMAQVAPVLAAMVSMLTNMESPVVVIGTNCNVLMASPSLGKVFGYSSEEITGRNVNMLMPKAIALQHDAIVARYTASARGSKKAERSTIVNNVRPTVGLHKNGRPVPLEVSVRAIRGKDNVPLMYLAVIRDTTSEAAMRSALREASFLEASFPFPYILADERGTIEKFNPAAEVVFGISSVFAVGKNVKIILPRKVQRNHDGFVQAYVRKLRDVRAKDSVPSRIVGCKSHRMTVRLKEDPSSGSICMEMLPVELQLEVNLSSDGAIKFYAFLRDLNTFASLEERKEEKRRADVALRIKDAFVASVSHELRTPLNGLMGAVQMLMDKPLTDDQAELVSIASDCGSTLLSTINTILDYSKGQAGKVTIDEAPLVLRDVMDSASRTVIAGARTKNTALDSYISPDVPAVVVGDMVKVRQVITNFLSNAIKFTPSGGFISLKCVLDDGDGDDASDVGNRVSSMLLAEDEGASASPASNHGSGHAGAGAQDGQDPDDSETVAVRFSVQDSGIGIPADKISSIFDAFSQADSSISRRFGGTGLGLFISRRLVQSMGGEIFVKSEEGVGSTFTFTCPFKRAENIDPPATATRTATVGGLAAAGGNAAGESDDDSDDDDDAHHAGDHPGGSSEGVAAGAAALRAEASSSTPEAAPANAAGSSRSPSAKGKLGNGKPGSLIALVVDDFDVNVLVIKTLLKHLGCSVLTSLSAAGAIEILERQRVDIVLSDLNMPEMDGIQLSREIKNSGNDVPVVIVTAGGRSRREEALHSGAVDFVEKPVTKDTLESVLAEHTRYIRTSQLEMLMLHADDVPVNGSIVGEMVQTVGVQHFWSPDAITLMRMLAHVWKAQFQTTVDIDEIVVARGYPTPPPPVLGAANPEANGRPFVVVLDRHMPGISGLEAAELIRGIEKDHPQLGSTPIILLSGDYGEELEAKAKDAGVSRTLSKPVKRSDIILALRWSHRDFTRKAKKAKRVAKKKSPAAAAGTEAPPAATAVPTSSSPSPASAPDKDFAGEGKNGGGDAARDRKKGEQQVEQEDQGGARGEGDTPRITRNLTPVLSTPASGSALPSPPTPTRGARGPPVVDPKTLFAVTNGNMDAAYGLVDSFLESADKDVQQLRDTAQVSVTTVGELAHRVRGAAMSLGLVRLGHAFNALESLAKGSPAPSSEQLESAVKSAVSAFDGTSTHWANM